MVADPSVRYFGAELGERTLVPGENAALGQIGFEEWLSQRLAARVPVAASWRARS